MPADPQRKGGSEATVRIAEADLLASDHNLRQGYGSWAELETACVQWMADVNTRAHRATQEAPVIRLAEELERLHRLPKVPHTVCFGEARKVNWQSVISVGGARYSVPHQLIDQCVWARIDGEELIVIRPSRPRARGGRPASADHAGPAGDLRSLLAQTATAARQSAEEQTFLQIGPDAEGWPIKAAAAGTQRLRRKLAEAVDLAKLHGAEEVTRALETRARAGRFKDGDLASILARQQHTGGELLLFPARETASLQRSTRA